MRNMELGQPQASKHYLSAYIIYKNIICNILSKAFLINNTGNVSSKSNITGNICHTAAELLTEGWNLSIRPTRAISIRASALCAPPSQAQLDLWDTEVRREHTEDLDRAIDLLRKRFGNHAVRRGTEIIDSRLANLDPEHDNTTHPISYFA